MPEGDTLFRAARALGERMTGATVTKFRSVLGPRIDRERIGKRIQAIESQGKNLLVRFDDGWTLHTHLRMSGSWRVFKKDEPWSRPNFQVRAAFEAGDWVAVCFLAPVVRMLRGDGTRELALGPDLLASEFDVPQSVERLKASSDLPIGEAIMVQRLVSGIGNVYKSEILFLEGIDPFRTVATLDDASLSRVMERARELMLTNVRPGAGMRATRVSPATIGRTNGPRYYVYGRSGDPCFRCGTRIEMRRQAHSRSTYFCPSCQSVAPKPKAKR